MPALAHKPTAESDQDYHVATARGAGSTPGLRPGVKRRWHESPPAGSTPRSRAEQRQRDEDWRNLVEHFGGDQTATAAAEKAELEERRDARRRARRRHRPFRMTVVATALVGAPLTLLACLLWMKSNALELSRADHTLQYSISATRFDLESTQREITSLKASPRVEQWAKERGWHQATQQDFDDVSKVATPINNEPTPEGNDAP